MVGNLIEKLCLGGQCSYIKGTERVMKQFLTIAARRQALSVQSQEWASQELTLLVPDCWH